MGIKNVSWQRVPVWGPGRDSVGISGLDPGASLGAYPGDLRRDPFDLQRHTAKTMGAFCLGFRVADFASQLESLCKRFIAPGGKDNGSFSAAGCGSPVLQFNWNPCVNNPERPKATTMGAFRPGVLGRRLCNLIGILV